MASPPVVAEGSAGRGRVSGDRFLIAGVLLVLVAGVATCAAAPSPRVRTIAGAAVRTPASTSSPPVTTALRPSFRAPATTQPTRSGHGSRCTAASVSLSVTGGDPGEGILVDAFHLQNTSDVSCVVSGFPDLTVLRAGTSRTIGVITARVSGQLLPTVPPAFALVQPTTVTTLTPDAAAVFYVVMDARPGPSCPYFWSRVSWRASAGTLRFPSSSADSMGALCPGSTVTVSAIGPGPGAAVARAG